MVVPDSHSMSRTSSADFDNTRVRHSSLGEERTTGLEDTTFNPGPPRPWHAPMTAMSLKLWRQLLGLNPFKTSYVGLFRTLDNPLDQAIAYCGAVCAIAAGVPLPIIVSAQYFPLECTYTHIKFSGCHFWPDHRSLPA